MSSPRQAAERALDLVNHDPTAAAALANDLLGSVASAPGPARLIAQWALGRTRYEHGDIAGAVATLRLAVEESAGAGPPELVAQVRLSLAVALIEAGSTNEAFAQLDLAEPDLSGGELGRLYSQRAFIYNHLGRLTDAIEAGTTGLRLLRAAGDRVGELRLLINRAVCHLNAGTLVAAQQDLAAAQPIAVALDATLYRALIAHNLGVVHARRGEIPRALACYDLAAATYATIGRPGRLGAILEIDKAETLLHAALYDEAVDVARQAVAETERAANVVNLADARLLLARALLGAGDPGAARDSAQQAEAACLAGGRAAWADLARVIMLEADIAGVPPAEARPGVMQRGRQLARQLEGEGWNDQADYVDSLVAEWALRWRCPEFLVDELDRVRSARRRGRPAARARACYVAALAAVASGERQAARRCLLRGLEIIDEHRDSLGASDLRARSVALASDLSVLGLHLAVDTDRTAAIFSWAERTRAWAFRGPRLHPPDDAELGRRLAEIRRLESLLREAAPRSPDHRSLLAQLSRAETAARDQARTATGNESTSRPSLRHPGRAVVALPDLQRLVGARWLVEYLVDDTSLFALVVTAQRVRLVALGALAAVQAECVYLTAEIRRALRDAATGRPARGAAAHATRHALNRLILAPLGLPGDAELVIVPTGPLHGILWPSLPDLANRVFSIAPSATSWTRMAVTAPTADREPFGLLLGPGLPGGVAEVDGLVATHPDAVTLRGDKATAEAARAMLARVRVAHVVAHGTYRSDNPMFSAFQMADGRLTVYDIETIEQPPELVVVSACDAGAQLVTRGDELLGMATAMLAGGVRTVVAPGVAIPDPDTPELIRLFYQGLSDGLTVAGALMAARAALWSSPSLGHQIAAWSFMCFGYSTTVAM